MRFTLATLFLAVVPGLSAQLPLFFFPNTGQADASVRYIVQTPDLSARFGAGEAIFQVHQQQTAVRFAGANAAVSIVGREPLAARVNFFLGTAAWKTDVPTYAKVVYRDLYPGIDLSYGGTGQQVKSEFLAAAGADPGLIRLEYSERVSLDAEGNLRAGDLFREGAPEIFQVIGGKNVKIAGRYRLLDQYTVGFEIGPYNRSLPLVIDPTISYCSYLGGSSTTAITGIALDPGANLYMTGWTDALNFPVDVPYQAVNAGGVDVFVAKLSAAGTGLLYATYIGGRSDDKGAAIAVDNLGQAYVTGSTTSTNFPLVSSNRSTLGGSTTAFVLKLSAAGNTLLYSGYLGGTTWEAGTAIAVDSSYNAYVAGDTQSANFPTKNGTQPTFGGNTDAFITKLNPAGRYAFSTFLGGAGIEHAGGIAVDSAGDIFVAGGTSSANFPVVSAVQGSLAGTQNAFVAKISAAGTVAFSTYLGGSGGTLQQANAIALDSAGNPYIAGVTNSANFPVSSAAFQNALNGEESAFATKITANGSAVVYSTYLGGDVSDWAAGIAVDAAGNAYVAGWTSSVNFPQASPVQAAFGGLTDAFISEFNFAGNGLIFSTYYGGSGSDSVTAIALDINANIFTGGQTGSLDLPLLHPIESTTAASSTGWFLRLGVTGLPATIPSVTSVLPASGLGSGVTFTAAFADTGGGSAITSAALLVNTSASTGSGCYVSYNPGTNLFSLYNDAGTTVLATVGPGGAVIQNDQCALSGIGSGATVAGTSLTVTYSLTFLTAFQGAKTVYLQAGDASSSTGWVAEGTFTVSFGCTASLNSASFSAAAAAGNSSVGFTLSSSCSWTATSNTSWLTITAGFSGSGNGTVSYSYAANSGAARAGTLTIGGQTFTVNQTGTFAAYPVLNFNGDADQDVFMYDPVAGTGYAGLSNGSGGFTYVYNGFTPGFDTIRFGNLNSGSFSDLVVYNSTSTLSYALLGNGAGTFTPVSLFWGPGFTKVAAGDVNGDGLTDFVIYRPTDGTTYTAISNGDGTFHYQYLLVSIGFTHMVVADFNGDGKADVFFYRSGDGLAYLGIGNGSGGFAFSAVALGPSYTFVESGDINGDGKADLLFYSSSTGAAAVGLSNGSGFALTPYAYSVGFTTVKLFDFNGDGKADVALYNMNNTLGYLGISNGTGNFTFSSLFWGSGMTAVDALDLNGDGKVDVVFYNTNNGASYTGISTGNASSPFTYQYAYWGNGKLLATAAAQP
jgi:hypothetical protein